MTEKKSDLTKDQYNICFLKGTEPPDSGKWLHNKESGEYICVNCTAILFQSDTKFDSGTGWPSFWDSVQANIKTKEDNSLGTTRTEVLCNSCNAHLGHIFNDGPSDKTGKRYCINSLALNFRKK